MPGIDAAHIQLHRLAPGARGVIGRNNVILAPAGGIVYIVLSVHLAQIRRINGIVAVFHSPGNGFPMQQVRRMPHQQRREIGERRMGHIKIVPVAENGGIRVIARENAGFKRGGLGSAAHQAGGQGQGEQELECIHDINGFSGTKNTDFVRKRKGARPHKEGGRQI